MFFSRDERPADRPLLAFVFLALLVGGVASIFTAPAIPGWYAGLAKPDFTPPDWVFAPVWTALYVLMGVAAARVWKTTHRRSASPFARSAPKGEVPVAGSAPSPSWARVASEGRRGFSLEIIFWAGQLALNLLWSILFFSLHGIGAALGEIAVLGLAVLATLLLFWRRDRIAGLLFLPYLAWVGFAIALNLAIWRLN